MKIRITAALMVLLLALLASGALAAYTPEYYNNQYNAYSSVPEKACQSVTCAQENQCPPATTCNKFCSPTTTSQNKVCPPVTTGQKKICPPTTSVCQGAYPAPVYPSVTPTYPTVTPTYPSVTPTYPTVTPTYPPVTPVYPPITPVYPPVTPPSQPPEQPPSQPPEQPPSQPPEQPPEKPPEKPEVPKKPEIPKFPEIPKIPKIPENIHYPNPLTPYNDKGDVFGKDGRGAGTTTSDKGTSDADGALRAIFRNGFSSTSQASGAAARLQERVEQIQHSANPNVDES